jgi:hypothetical protein
LRQSTIDAIVVVAMSAVSKLASRYFATVNATTTAVSLAAGADGRSCSVETHGGNYVRYVCVCKKTADCGWFVTAGEPTKKQIASSSMKPGGFVIKKINDVHVQFCPSTTRYRANHLRTVDEVRNTVAAIRDAPAEVLRDTMRSSSAFNIDHMSRSSLQRLRKGVQKDISEGTADDTKDNSIVRLLLSFATLNPGSTVALQVDSFQRLFRVFLCPAAATRASNSQGTFNMFFIDGTHSKCGDYDGMHIQLVGRDGEQKNTILAVALVPKENCSNMVWFIRMCLLSGLAVDDKPIFCDRGHLLSAAVALRESGVFLNLKYCTEHIIRNVVSKFQLQNNKDIKGLLYRLQGAKLFSSYCNTLDEITRHCGWKLRVYLIGIDPMHWCVFANRSLSWCNNEEHMSEYDLFCAYRKNQRWLLGIQGDAPSGGGSLEDNPVSEEVLVSSTSLVPLGFPARLYNNRDTNAVEGENNAALLNGSRSSSPFIAIYSHMLRFMHVYSVKNDKANDFIQQGLSGQLVIPKDYWKKTQASADQFKVSITNIHNQEHAVLLQLPQDIKFSASVFFPTVANCSTRVFVTESRLLCTCSNADQTGLPCPHVVATVRALISCGAINAVQYQDLVRGTYDAVYFVDSYIDAFYGNVVTLPVEDECQALSQDPKVLPPPRYRRVRLGRPHKKRIRSSGEEANGSQSWNSSRALRTPSKGAIGFNNLTNNARRVGKLQSSPLNSNVDSNYFFRLAEDNTSVTAQLQENTMKPESHQTRSYKCSRCQSAGHNAKTCPFKQGNDDYVEPENLHPGHYVVMIYNNDGPWKLRTGDVMPEAELPIELQVWEEHGNSNVGSLLVDFHLSEMRKLEDNDAEENENGPNNLEHNGFEGHDNEKENECLNDGREKGSNSNNKASNGKKKNKCNDPEQEPSKRPPQNGNAAAIPSTSDVLVDLIDSNDDDNEQDSTGTTEKEKTTIPFRYKDRLGKWKMTLKQKVAILGVDDYEEQATLCDQEWYKDSTGKSSKSMIELKQTALKLGNNTILWEDFVRLRPGECLTDPIMNFYMSILNQRETMQIELGGTLRKRSYFTSSFFFTTLLDKDKEGRIRQYNHAGASKFLKGMNFGNLDTFYAPVHDGLNHWQLVVCNVLEKKIVAMDPFHNRSRYANDMLCFLREYHRADPTFLFNEGDWNVIEHPPADAAKQDGGKCQAAF